MPKTPAERKGAPEALPEDSGLRQLLPLAHGVLSPEHARQLVKLKATIQRTLNLDCDSYKEPCLRRRVATRMRARGVHDYEQYGKLLDSDEGERERLLDAITINVSKFYRNAETWRVIETRIVPELFKLEVPRIRIWSAGCASGEEPYTMAMVLRLYAEQHKLTNRLRKFDILGTDIDRGVLALAAKGEYGAFAFTEIAPAVRERFFEENRVKPDIKRMVRFEELNLMEGEFPKAVHLLFCRNVIIYFGRNVQEALFQKFHDALAPGGFLVLGKVETLFGAAAPLFKSLATRERVFCKV